MSETHEARSKRRQGYAWLSFVSFVSFVVASLSLGSVFAFRDLPRYLGFDLDRELAGFDILLALLAALFTLVLLLYLGAILWLLFARAVFTRSEIRTVVFYASAGPVERWLFDKIVPERKPGDSDGRD